MDTDNGVGISYGMWGQDGCVGAKGENGTSVIA